MFSTLHVVIWLLYNDKFFYLQKGVLDKILFCVISRKNRSLIEKVVSPEDYEWKTFSLELFLRYK